MDESVVSVEVGGVENTLWVLLLVLNGNSTRRFAGGPRVNECVGSMGGCCENADGDGSDPRAKRFDSGLQMEVENLGTHSNFDGH